MSHDARPSVLKILAAAQILLLLTLQLATNNCLLCAHAMIASNRLSIEDEQVGFPPGELIVGLGNESREALQTWIEKWNGAVAAQLPEIRAFLVSTCAAGTTRYANMMRQSASVGSVIGSLLRSPRDE